MNDEQRYERWRELFEELERGTDQDSQALFEQALPCFYKTHPSEPLADDAPPGTSHIGGFPDLPSSLSWPVDGEGRALTFLAQVNLDELDNGFAPYLPPHGWLYFFLEEKDIWSDIPHRVLYFDGVGEEVRKSRPPVVDGTPGRRYHAFRLQFESGFTLYGAVMDALFADHPEWKAGGRESQILFDRFQGERTRVGGHPMSFQSLSEQYAYLKLGGYDVLYEYGTSLDSLEHLIHRERLEQEDPELVAYLRTEVARQIEEYHHDFAIHRQRMRTIRPVFVLGSEEDMLWGDAGYLQFFMHENDLANRDFSITYCEVIST